MLVDPLMLPPWFHGNANAESGMASNFREIMLMII